MIWPALGIVVAIAVLGWLRLGWLVVTVSGPSMQPTLRSGDRLLVRRTSVGGVRAGQVVVLDTEFRLIVKRVAAVPGDRVPPGVARGADERVPAGRLVLLGDNPSASIDSRAQGYYDGTHLIGVAVRPLSRSRA